MSYKASDVWQPRFCAPRWLECRFSAASLTLVARGSLWVPETTKGYEEQRTILWLEHERGFVSLDLARNDARVVNGRGGQDCADGALLVAFVAHAHGDAEWLADHHALDVLQFQGHVLVPGTRQVE